MRVFISYRRRRDAPAAVGLKRALDAAGGLDDVFLDTASIAVGEAFPDRIREAIGGARLLVLLIGPDWVDEMRDRDPDADFVRREIAFARDEGVLIYPVYLSDAPTLASAGAPDGLGFLADLNADRVDYARVEAEFDRVAANVVALAQGEDRTARLEREELIAKRFGPLRRDQFEHPDLLLREHRFDPARGLVIRPIQDDAPKEMPLRRTAVIAFALILGGAIAAGLAAGFAVKFGVVAGSRAQIGLSAIIFFGVCFAGAWRFFRAGAGWFEIPQDRRVYKFDFTSRDAGVFFYAGSEPPPADPLGWDTPTAPLAPRTRLELRCWRIGDGYVAAAGLHQAADADAGQREDFFRRIAVSRRKPTEIEAVRPVFEFAQGLAASMKYAPVDWPSVRTIRERARPTGGGT